MSHTIREKTKLLARVRRMRGQLDAVERSLENEAPCAEVLQLVASIRGAMNGFMGELLEDHINQHLVDPTHAPNTNRAQAAKELIDVLRTYLK